MVSPPTAKIEPVEKLSPPEADLTEAEPAPPTEEIKAEEESVPPEADFTKVEPEQLI